MYEEAHCRRCGKELTGVLESTSVTSGKYVFVTVRETTDCNWSKCPCCRQILCKKCYAELPNYCCEEGRIVDRERARAASMLGNGSSRVVPTRPTRS